MSKFKPIAELFGIIASQSLEARSYNTYECSPCDETFKVEPFAGQIQVVCPTCHSIEDVRKLSTGSHDSIDLIQSCAPQATRQAVAVCKEAIGKALSTRRHWGALNLTTGEEVTPGELGGAVDGFFIIPPQGRKFDARKPGDFIPDCFIDECNQRTNGIVHAALAVIAYVRDEYVDGEKTGGKELMLAIAGLRDVNLPRNRTVAIPPNCRRWLEDAATAEDRHGKQLLFHLRSIGAV